MTFTEILEGTLAVFVAVWLFRRLIMWAEGVPMSTLTELAERLETIAAELRAHEPARTEALINTPGLVEALVDGLERVKCHACLLPIVGAIGGCQKCAEARAALRAISHALAQEPKP